MSAVREKSSEEERGHARMRAQPLASPRLLTTLGIVDARWDQQVARVCIDSIPYPVRPINEHYAIICEKRSKRFLGTESGVKAIIK